MNFDVWAELVCRKCAATTLGRHYYGPIDLEYLQKKAEAEGWRIVDFNGYRDWLCTRCAQKEGLG